MSKKQQASPPQTSGTDFTKLAEESQPGLLREFADFLVQNNLWWIAPIIIVLLLVVFFVYLGSTAAAPFIYTVF